MSEGCLHGAGDRSPLCSIPRFLLEADGVCLFSPAKGDVASESFCSLGGPKKA